MTLRMQGLLLRFLETGELQKVGADRSRTTVNIRVIAATNRNLRELITQQAFREDHRILKPGRHLGLYVSDSYVHGQGFHAIGFE